MTQYETRKLNPNMGQDSSVGIATCMIWLDGPGMGFRGVGIFCTRPDQADSKKICPVGAELFHLDWHPDRHVEAKSHFAILQKWILKTQWEKALHDFIWLKFCFRKCNTFDWGTISLSAWNLLCIRKCLAKNKMTVLDFRLLLCCECCTLSLGWFTGIWFLCADVAEHSVCSIFIGCVSFTRPM
jgi:hypothetical protein